MLVEHKNFYGRYEYPIVSLVRIDNSYVGEKEHPIKIGSEKIGVLLRPPYIGKGCMVDVMKTSKVTKILISNEKEIVFRTKNSTYKIELSEQKGA